METNTENKDLTSNDGNTMLDDALPPIGVVVEALVRYSKDWGKVLGEKNMREKIKRIRRLKSKDNSRGWNWSHPDIITCTTGEVIWWRFI